MQPSDQQLYDRIKRKYQLKMPNSAYRSGLIVKSYKAAYKKKHPDSEPYIGAKKKTVGLKRWFAEEWRNESGKVGYDKNNTLYRPTKRITKSTPKTWTELSDREVKAAKITKKKRGRVNKF